MWLVYLVVKHDGSLLFCYKQNESNRALAYSEYVNFQLSHGNRILCFSLSILHIDYHCECSVSNFQSAVENETSVSN